MMLLLALALVAAPDPWMGRDKALHLGGSMFSTGGIYAGLRVCHVQPKPALWWAIGATAAACVGKEVADHYTTRAGASWKDLTVDAVGIGLTATAIALLNRR